MNTATTGSQAKVVNAEAQEIIDMLTAAGYKARTPFRRDGPHSSGVLASDPISSLKGRHLVVVEYKDHITFSAPPKRGNSSTSARKGNDGRHPPGCCWATLEPTNHPITTIDSTVVIDLRKDQ